MRAIGWFGDDWSLARGGIVPDVPISPMIEDLLAGRDPMMERALLFLEKK